MRIDGSLVAKAAWSMQDDRYVHAVHDDNGEPCLAYSGAGFDATLLFHLLYQGMLDGKIQVNIDDDWHKLDYWNRLALNIHQVYDEDHQFSPSSGFNVITIGQ